jgi:hypothetical protein
VLGTSRNLWGDAVGNCVVVIAGVITNPKPAAVRFQSIRDAMGFEGTKNGAPLGCAPSARSRSVCDFCTPVVDKLSSHQTVT